MELWFQLTPGQAALVELMGEMNIAYDLMRGFMPSEESDDLMDDIKLERRDEWTVLMFGLPKPTESQSP